jgi:carboxypeptidase C (cathepsin A)
MFVLRRGVRSLIVPFFVVALGAVAFADDAKPDGQSAGQSVGKSDAKPAGPEPKPLRFESNHTLALHAPGRETKLDYVAVGETTLLSDDAGAPEAEFFSISYCVKGSGDASARPVTFAFNGGPGSSSIWLHLGLLGPRLIQVPSDAQPAGAPPFTLIDNPDPLLAASDVVFVDPVGTGFSRVVGKGDTANFWGVDEDAASVARFIRRWISDHGRWASPKYLLGESYGGIRGPLLVRELQGGMSSMALNGVILISPALDMAVVDGQENDAALATVLPTFAATAWYHDALPKPRPPDLDAFLRDVGRFVSDEYVPALFAGRAIPDSRRDQLVDQLHRFTGLSADYLRRANLKVTPERFRRELLRERGLVVGRLDTRYTGTEPDAVGERPSGDPMSAGISGAFVAGFMDYLRSSLGVVVDRDYVVMSPEAGAHWKRPKESEPAFSGYVDVAPALARGMAENPQLRVFVASGLYDLATTFFAAEHNVRRSTMPLDRVELHRYPAGHMMYVNQPSREMLSRELRAFVGNRGEEKSAAQ